MYAKVFAQIYDGSLCTSGPWQALVTFQQMLVLADQNGVVDMTAAAIARRTTIPLDIIETGIAALLKPDPESRTPLEDGRRIVQLSEGRSWGWQIVNFRQYHAIRSQEDRREYHREYWRAKRSPNARPQTPQQAQQNSSVSTYTDTDTDTDVDAEVTGERTESSSSPSALEAGVAGFALTPPEPPTDAKRERRKALGHFVPEDFAVRGSDADWARAEFPAVDLFTETQKFRDHEFDKPRSDWHRAWRNWIRKAGEGKGVRRG